MYALTIKVNGGRMQNKNVSNFFSIYYDYVIFFSLSFLILMSQSSQAISLYTSFQLSMSHTVSDTVFFSLPNQSYEHSWEFELAHQKSNCLKSFIQYPRYELKDCKTIDLGERKNNSLRFLICVLLQIWFFQTGSSKRILPSCNFKSDRPGFQCLTTEKERETVIFGWHLVSWRNKQRENRVHGEVLRATAKIDQIKTYQQMRSFSLSPYLSISFFLCVTFMLLSVKQFFKYSLCICKIAK